MQAQAERAKQQLFEANLAGADGGLPVLMSDENPDAIIMISDTGIIQYTNLVSSGRPNLPLSGVAASAAHCANGSTEAKVMLQSGERFRRWVSCQ